MKVTNAEIYNASQPLRELLKIKLPGMVSLELVKLAKAMREHADAIEQVRTKLIRDYGVQDEKVPGRSTISPKDEGFPKFAEEFGELLGQPVDIKFDVVKLPSTIVIEPYILMALETFVGLDEATVVVEVGTKK